MYLLLSLHKVFCVFILLGINENFDKISCHYAGALGRVVFCDGRAVGVRKDLSGVMLVETALQTAVDNIEDAVHVELLLSEVSHFFTCISFFFTPYTHFLLKLCT